LTDGREEVKEEDEMDEMMKTHCNQERVSLLSSLREFATDSLLFSTGMELD